MRATVAGPRASIAVTALARLSGILAVLQAVLNKAPGQCKTSPARPRSSPAPPPASGSASRPRSPRPAPMWSWPTSRRMRSKQAAHGLSGTNKRVMPVRIDVTQEQSVLDALAEAERNFGKLHIACNNAGVPMHGTRLVDVPPGDWEFVIGVNIWGIIHGIRHFVPAILKHGEEGHVVNTASVAGFQNRRGTNQGPYSMSEIRRPVLVRGAGARAGRHQCRRLGAVPRSDQHQYRARRPQPPGPYGRPADPRQRRSGAGRAARHDRSRSEDRSASASSTRSAPRRSTPLSARSRPMSSGPATAASRRR